ncbi:MAG: 5-carboxymethyl-2-hydroxymuconate Delta-isomerase [Pseudoalteromonas prydzensis]|uniref:5-carboxymethyl-2-hydroxymuconate Delta-isomerase n=1 Tax=Pseudoalteromonas prydzensis TaxID=182141 RepID=UPI003F982333
MPHFIIDCSQSILTHHDEDTINEQIHHTANASDLFAEHEIKVRVNPFKTYLVGNKQTDFIHVFAHIMQGRSTQQKAALSKAMVTKLSEMFPAVSNIAMNVADFEQASYCNRNML